MTDSIFNELRTIRSRIESIERTQEVLVRAEAERILATLLPRFDEDPTLGRVYLLVDGARGQKLIAKAMASSGVTGASEATVSRKLELLRELDLVELDDRTAIGNVYKKRQLDRLLHLTRHVERILERRGR